ncbi:hypothetical protein BH23BAC1_BH23BAC1_21830 [soil metagenome]
MGKIGSFLKVLMIVLALSIAGYAITYLTFETTGFLNSKEVSLLGNKIWLSAFYIHIIFGIVSLALGGFQFFKSFRDKNLKLHRKTGIIYVFSVFISGFAGLFLAFFANGGWIASVGFAGLALSWLVSNYFAFTYIKEKDIKNHEFWMIRNYAVTLAAVTLRIWIPVLMIFFALPFIEAYKIVAWLSWLPNLLVAELIIRNMQKTPGVPKVKMA